MKDAPILILDEPTSSVDPETESLLETSTRRLMQGRTVITIAHRLNTIFKADQIDVLDEGRILEQGSHRELLAINGAYAEMVKAYGAPGWDFESKMPGLSFAGSSNLLLDLRLPTIDDQQISHFPSPISSQQLPVTRNQRILFRLLSFLNGSWALVALSVLLSTLTIGSSVALIGTSAWLISTAALHVSVADLGVSVVGVRFFGNSRGVFRYLERLVS